MGLAGNLLAIQVAVVALAILPQAATVLEQRLAPPVLPAALLAARALLLGSARSAAAAVVARTAPLAAMEVIAASDQAVVAQAAVSAWLLPLSLVGTEVAASAYTRRRQAGRQQTPALQG